MNTLQWKNIPFELKSTADGAAGTMAICTFEGDGACLMNLDGWGDILDVGSLDDTLPFTKDRGIIRNEHWVTTGKITDAMVTSTGLNIKGSIFDTAPGRDQSVLLKSGTIKGLSIGWTSQRKDRYILDSPDAVKAFWASKGYTPQDDDLANLESWGGGRVVTKAKVYEVSTTWMPANTRAQVTSVKADPRAGSDFDERASQVLATLGSFVERVESIQAKAKSKPLADRRRLELKAMSRRIEALLLALEAKTASEEATTNIDSDMDMDKVYAGVLAMGLRMQGVAI